jgi:hypothetical protein
MNEYAFLRDLARAVYKCVGGLEVSKKILVIFVR